MNVTAHPPMPRAYKYNYIKLAACKPKKCLYANTAISRKAHKTS